MKTNTENTTKTNEEIIADLKEQLKKAQEKKDKCKTSTLKKVGFATLGLGALAGAAAAGFYYGTREMGDTTVVISE